MLSGSRFRPQTLDIFQRSHQTLDLLDPVTDGNIRQDISDITEFDLDIVFVTEQIVYFNTRQTDISGIDGQLRHIIIIDAAAVHQIFSVGVIAADGIDLAAGVFRHILYLFKRFTATER